MRTSLSPPLVYGSRAFVVGTTNVISCWLIFAATSVPRNRPIISNGKYVLRLATRQSNPYRYPIRRPPVKLHFSISVTIPIVRDVIITSEMMDYRTRNHGSTEYFVTRVVVQKPVDYVTSCAPRLFFQIFTTIMYTYLANRREMLLLKEQPPCGSTRILTLRL